MSTESNFLYQLISTILLLINNLNRSQICLVSQIILKLLVIFLIESGGNIEQKKNNLGRTRMNHKYT